MPMYSVTACYYATTTVEATNEADAIDKAYRELKLPGGLPFDEYEVECLDEEE